MTRPKNYQTKQRDAILNYIVSLDGAHITAAQIARHFEKVAAPIGKATIYRCLDKLTENGNLRRYITDGISGACYQYVETASPDDACLHDAHLHLKCDDCGELLHLECDALDELERHISGTHAFQVNTTKTVLYGRCEDCLRKT